MVKFRKLLAVLVSALVMICVLPFSVYAEHFEGEPYLTMWMGSYDDYETVTIEVSVSEFEKLGGFQFDLDYDAERFRLTDYTVSRNWERPLGDYCYASNPEEGKIITICEIGDTGKRTSDGGMILEAEFELKEGAEAEGAEFRLSNITFACAEGMIASTENVIPEGRGTDVRKIHVPKLRFVEGIEPTCTEDGMYEHYIDDETGDLYWYDDYPADEEELIIPALGHRYEMSGWNWASDLSSAELLLVCANDSSHRETVKADIRTTTDQEGRKIYIATAEGPDGRTYIDRKVENQEDYIIRIYGQLRYDTSRGIADELKELLGVDKFENVIVASGSGFADALAGGYLAYKKNAPILIVNKKTEVMEEMKKYIRANLVPGGTVYILGGTGAVLEEMETGLDGFDVHRLGGGTRYETNLMILDEAGVTNEEILIADSTSFADSLSASAAGRPILLVSKTKGFTDEQYLFLRNHYGNQYYVLGGTSAVPAEAMWELRYYGPVERLGGSGRYETSAIIAGKLCPHAENAVLAYGGNFPDGLCGGPLAAVMGAPLILTRTAKETDAKKYCVDHDVSSGYVLGGTALISDEAANIILNRGSRPIKVEEKYSCTEPAKN